MGMATNLQSLLLGGSAECEHSIKQKKMLFTVHFKEKRNEVVHVAQLIKVIRKK